MDDNKFILKGFKQIKKFFDQHLDKERLDYYQVVEGFSEYMNVNMIKKQIKQIQRFKIQLDDFKYDQFEQFIYHVLNYKRNLQRSVNRLGHKLNKGIFASDETTYNFCKQVYKLYVMQQIIDSLFANVSRQETVIDGIKAIVDGFQ